jgi:nucleoside-diphosphate-sugar epimerase
MSVLVTGAAGFIGSNLTDRTVDYFRDALRLRSRGEA